VTELESDCVSRCISFTIAFILQVKYYFYNCSKSIELVYVRNYFKYFDVNSRLFVSQFPVFKTLFLRSSLVCMYVCMYVCTYVCILYVCTYVCMYICILYVCTYVCMYVRKFVCIMYVCMYVRMYVLCMYILCIMYFVRMYLRIYVCIHRMVSVY